MNSEVKLELPERGKKKEPVRKGGNLLLWIILMVVTAGVVVNLAAIRSKVPGGVAAVQGMSWETRRDLALKLEKQGLNTAALEEWRQCARYPGIDAVERARVFYRIGKLCQESGRYEDALQAYYTSESCAGIDELSNDMTRRIKECLEASGNYAAMSRELADRVEIGPKSSAETDTVVAEIGPEKITMADLDQRMQQEIENQISQYAGMMPRDQLMKRKEEMLKELKTGSARRRFLQQYIIEEVLYRKAIDSGLREKPEIRDLIRQTERKILAAKLLEGEMQGKTLVSDEDVETWYKANQDSFVVPAGVRISHIMTKSKEDAEKALASLKDGEDFGKLAGELSLDKSSASNGGEVPGWLSAGDTRTGIGDCTAVVDAVADLQPGDVAEKPVKSDKGWHVVKLVEKREKSVRPLDQVRDVIYRNLTTRKQMEVNRELFDTLKDKYDVVVHESVFGEADVPDKTEQE